MNLQDRRYNRTHKAIKNSFIKLLREQENNSKITITDICADADINRGTFYLHFDTIVDLTKEMESDYSRKLINTCSIYKYDKNTFAFFNSLFDSVKQNPELFYFFFYISDGTGLKSLEAYLRKYMVPEWLKSSKINESEANIVIKYQLTGTFALLKDWYERNFENEKEYRHVFDRIVKYGLYDLVYLDKSL